MGSAVGLLPPRSRGTDIIREFCRRRPGCGHYGHAVPSEAGSEIDLLPSTLSRRRARVVSRVLHAGGEPFRIEPDDVLDENDNVAGGLTHPECSKLGERCGRRATNEGDRRVRSRERVEVVLIGGARHDDLGPSARALVDDRRETARESLRVPVGRNDNRDDRGRTPSRCSKGTMPLQAREPATG